MERQPNSLQLYPWLLIVLLLISSCTQVTVRDYDELSFQVKDRYLEAFNLVETEEIYWVQSFSAWQLTQDREELLSHNHDVEAALSRVRQAAHAYGVTKADLLPSIDINTDYSQERISGRTTSAETGTEKWLSFGAVLHWEPDIWGRLRAREAAASLKLEEQEVLSRQVWLNLQTVLVETWISFQTASTMEKVIAQQLNTNLQMLSLTQLRLAQGDGNSLDILQQKGQLLGVERSLPVVVATKKRAANSYAVLLGRLPGEAVISEDSWSELEPLYAITTPYKLLSERPDLRAAYLALQAADQEVAAAVADRLPRISIELVYTESGSRLSKLGDYSVLNLTSGLVAPLFDAGRLKARENQQRAVAAERLAILEQTLLIAIKEVENGLVQEKSLFEQYSLLTKELSIAEETVDKARFQYIHGLQTFLPVLAALTKHQKLQLEEIRLKRNILVNRGHLLKALGAKWSDNLEN